MHRNEKIGEPDRPTGQLPGSGSQFSLRGDHVLGLIINPNSRRNKKHLRQITQTVSNCANIYYRMTIHPGEISKALSDFANKSVNVLAISGGDGTVSRVLTHLFKEKPFETMPLIAILPGGTANMIAGDVGLHGGAHAALRRLCHWIEDSSGRTQLLHRPVLRVQTGGRPASYGMFFGAGAIMQGIEYAHQNIHSRGLKDELSLGFGLARSMWGIARRDPRFRQPVNISIGIDGKPPAPPESMILLLVSGLERLFLGMHPYWGEDDGKPLHTTMIRNPAIRLLRNLPSLLRGKPNRRMSPDTGYLSYNVERISLNFEGPFTLDGETLHASIASGPVEVSNGGELVFLRIQDG